MEYVYGWKMDERTPIDIDHQQVNHIGYIDLQTSAQLEEDWPSTTKATREDW